jgi:outer membrane protein assembly factor BamB
VYAGDLDGKFICREAATGKEVWSFDAESEISAGASFADDNVIFGTGDESLFCLTPQGKKSWVFKVPGGPVLATSAVANGMTFVAGCDSNMHMIELKTGKEVASVDIGSQTGATPAVRGDIAYLGTQGNQVLAIDLKKKEAIWGFEPESRKQPFNSSAAVTEKYVIVGCQNKRLYCLDRMTGKEVWAFVTEGRVDGSPVVVGERVYVGSQDGNLYVIDLAKGTEIQRLKLDDAITASPAVSNGRLVIGTAKGAIYCFGAK